MATIQMDRGILTLIITFDIQPHQQQSLLDSLQRFIQEIVKDQPAFISANLHRSEDGTRVVNYAQWSDRKAFEAFRKDPQVIEAGAEVFSYNPDIRIYDVVHTEEHSMSRD